MSMDARTKIYSAIKDISSIIFLLERKAKRILAEYALKMGYRKTTTSLIKPMI